jgi:hypothetical protein
VYEGGPKRAIGGIASALKTMADRGLLAIDDPLAAATHFNWLVMPIGEGTIARYCG